MPLAALLLAAAAPALGCADRITGAVVQYPDGRRVEDSFAIDRRQDLVAGPLGLTGLRRLRARDWAWLAARDQWLKSPMVLRPGRRVTLVVPRAQRSWMRIVHGGARLTLRACPRGGPSSGSSGNTAWSGGFEIDYAKAPRQGRCARIHVRVDGRTLRRRIAPRAGAC